MNGLVTGGAGFIGSTIVEHLLARGDKVRVLDNLTSGHRSNLFMQAEFLEGDVRDPHAVLRAMEDIDVVFHLAASVGNRRSMANPSSDAETNAMGTLNVLEAARFTGCRKVVYSSSAAIFGEPRAVPIPAGHPTSPLTPYGVSKLAGENYVLAYNQLYDFKGICLRYFNVYGPRQRFDAYGNVIPIFATRLRAGEPLVVYGDGAQTRDFVNVEDVARANLLAADARNVAGAFNVGSGVATTIGDLAAIVAALSGAELRVLYEAPRAGDVRHSHADISSTEIALSYRPSVELHSGLQRYLRWLESVETEASH